MTRRRDLMFILCPGLMKSGDLDLWPLDLQMVHPISFAIDNLHTVFELSVLFDCWLNKRRWHVQTKHNMFTLCDLQLWPFVFRVHCSAPPPSLKLSRPFVLCHAIFFLSIFGLATLTFDLRSSKLVLRCSKIFCQRKGQTDAVQCAMQPPPGVMTII